MDSALLTKGLKESFLKALWPLSWKKYCFYNTVFMCLLCVMLHNYLVSIIKIIILIYLLSNLCFQETFTELEETAGERSFNYANMKFIKGSAFQGRFDKSSGCFSIFTAWYQIKFQLIFSKRITTFKQIITLHSKT